jgi:hypothetical protein
MVFTRKFSEFVPEAVSEVVGLTSGANSIGPNSGGGGSVVEIITQDTTGLAVGDWVRINSAGLYVPAKGDSAQDAEVVGVVKNILSISQFTLQQAGYILTTDAVFTGLNPSDVYFLSTTTAGAMQDVDAVVNGQVSRPVFVADTPTSGWVLPYRGLIVGGASPSGAPGGFGLQWNVYNAGGTINMSPFNGYIITGATLTTMVLPAMFEVGDLIIIYNFGVGGYLVSCGTNQSIQYAAVMTQLPTGGSISSTNIGDSLMLIGLVPNLTMGVVSSTGNQDEV